MLSSHTVEPCFDESCRHWVDTDGNRIEAHAAGMLLSPINGRWYWYGESSKSAAEREDEESLWDNGVNCYSAPGIGGPWRNEGQVLRQTDVKVDGL